MNNTLILNTCETTKQIMIGSDKFFWILLLGLLFILVIKYSKNKKGLVYIFLDFFLPLLLIDVVLFYLFILKMDIYFFIFAFIGSLTSIAVLGHYLIKVIKEKK